MRRYIQYEKDNNIYIHIDAFCGYCQSPIVCSSRKGNRRANESYRAWVKLL